MSFEEYVSNLKPNVLVALLKLYEWEEENDLGRHKEKIESLIKIIESKKKDI